MTFSLLRVREPTRDAQAIEQPRQARRRAIVARRAELHGGRQLSQRRMRKRIRRAVKASVEIGDLIGLLHAQVPVREFELRPGGDMTGPYRLTVCARRKTYFAPFDQ